MSAAADRVVARPIVRLLLLLAFAVSPATGVLAQDEPSPTAPSATPAGSARAIDYR